MPNKMSDSKRMAAMRRKRGRMLGVEGPKGKSDSRRRSQGAKANRQAKAEYIRKTPKGDGARLKPRDNPPRRYIKSGKK